MQNTNSPFLCIFSGESYLLEVDVDMKIIARLHSLKNCYFYHKDRHNIHAGHINSQYVYFGVIITIQSFIYLLFAKSILQFTHHMILQD